MFAHLIWFYIGFHFVMQGCMKLHWHQSDITPGLNYIIIQARNVLVTVAQWGRKKKQVNPENVIKN